MLVYIRKRFFQLDKIGVGATSRKKRVLTPSGRPLDSCSVIKWRLMIRLNNFVMQLVSEIVWKAAGPKSRQLGFGIGTTIAFRQ